MAEWAVERRVFSLDEEDRLLDALRDRGVTAREFVGHEFRGDEGLLRAAVPRGSCFFVRQASDEPGFRDDLWGRPEDFAVSAWRKRLGRAWLNDRAAAMSLGEFKWTLADHADATGRAFVRPDDALKSFPGGVIDAAGLVDFAETCRVFQVPDSTPVWTARPVPIRGEWRVVVIGGRVIAGSRYKPEAAGDLPADVAGYAGKVAACRPVAAEVFVVDVAATDGGLRVVEVGSLLCCGLYETPFGPVVEAVNSLLP